MIKEKAELLTKVAKELDSSNKKVCENGQSTHALQALFLTRNLLNMVELLLREFWSKCIYENMIATAIVTSIKQKRRLCKHFVRDALHHLQEEIHEEINSKIICEIQEKLTPWKILCVLDLAGGTCSFWA